MANARGQYGTSTRIGASVPEPPSRSLAPWLLGGAGLVVTGLALLGVRAARQAEKRTLSPHEREVQAWNKEFPGLPWYMDEVQSACQLDLWERARDHWEQTH